MGSSRPKRNCGGRCLPKSIQKKREETKGGWLALGGRGTARALESSGSVFCGSTPLDPAISVNHAIYTTSEVFEHGGFLTPEASMSACSIKKGTVTGIPR